MSNNQAAAAGYRRKAPPPAVNLLEVARWEGAGVGIVTLANPSAQVLRITRDSGSADRPAIRLTGVSAANHICTARLQMSGWDPTLVDQLRWGPGRIVNSGSSLWLAVRLANNGGDLRMQSVERLGPTVGDGKYDYVSPPGDPYLEAWDLETTVNAGVASFRFKNAAATAWTSVPGRATAIAAGGIGLIAGSHPAGFVCDVLAFSYEVLP